jgi:hypothetical protein
MLPPFCLSTASRALGLRALFAVALLTSACSGIRTPDEMAAIVQRDAPACERGDKSACRVACANEGPNATCDAACRDHDPEGCFRLAGRLERGVDAPDPRAARTSIGDQDSARITSLYEQACDGGLASGCRLAGERLLTGQGTGGKADGGARAVKLLKRGCETLQDGLACCGMSQLNQGLAQSGGDTVSPDDGFAIEARKWRGLATRFGATCPEGLSAASGAKP